ncbi:DNA-directed RNA polymerase subunit alpha C-terminal domain-containing protein [Nocardia fluminea]|uniref:DNA-directed RNA polymerase subunit alpha C-terminal domain-containing protein n=1 Tax=Nocardia fluminea TaxID=134984 RepID=UPI003D0B57A0
MGTDLPGPDAVSLSTILSPRVANLLGRVGIDTVGQLVVYSASDLTGMTQVGQLTIAEIITALAEHNRALAPDPTVASGATLVERHRALLEQQSKLLALLQRIAVHPRTPKTVRGDIDEVMGQLDTTLSLEQAALVARQHP